VYNKTRTQHYTEIEVRMEVCMIELRNHTIFSYIDKKTTPTCIEHATQQTFVDVLNEFTGTGWTIVGATLQEQASVVLLQRPF
jgi:hypothetical protein